MAEKPKKTLHKGEGHRKRLRDRFLKSGLDGFADYEVIELLLTLATPRKDCKDAAKAALSRLNPFRASSPRRRQTYARCRASDRSTSWG